MFGVRKFWHKRIVRSGVNTLEPYRSNPEELTLRADDIVFFDFGPIFSDWEADVGRTTSSATTSTSTASRPTCR